MRPRAGVNSACRGIGRSAHDRERTLATTAARAVVPAKPGFGYHTSNGLTSIGGALSRGGADRRITRKIMAVRSSPGRPPVTPGILVGHAIEPNRPIRRRML